MSNLLINEPPLQVLPSLAVAIGLNEAIILQQVHYWLRHAKVEHDGKLWFYKTYEEWKRQDLPFWSIDTIKRTIRSLKKQELLLVKKLSSNSFNRVNHYTINYTKLDEISSKAASTPVNTDEGNMPLSEDAGCTQHEGNMPLSDEGNMPLSDEGNMHRCLREYKETTQENTKEKGDVTENDQLTNETTEEKPLTSKQIKKIERTETINLLFSKWLELSGQRITASDKRLKHINARLNDGFTVEQITEAMTFVATDDWHISEGHNTIEIAIRSTEQIEAKLIKAAAVKAKQNKPANSNDSLAVNNKWGIDDTPMTDEQKASWFRDSTPATHDDDDLPAMFTGNNQGVMEL